MNNSTMKMLTTQDLQIKQSFYFKIEIALTIVISTCALASIFITITL